MQGMNKDYQKAYIACMQRNRDNDGKNDIDENEIRWYLAAYNQYLGMYVGEPSISAESRLYYYPDTYDPSQNLKHYASSTTSGSVYSNDRGDDQKKNNTTRIIWAEEATTFCTLNQRQNYTGNNVPTDTWNSWDEHTIHYRCVRNLGYDETKGYGYYDNYVTGPSSKPNSGVATINPRFLNFNINSRRDDTSGELNPHTYRPDEMDNKLSGSFEINFDYHPSSSLRMSILAEPEIVSSYSYTYTEKTRTETQTRRYGQWSQST